MASRVWPFDKLRVTMALNQLFEIALVSVTLSLSKGQTREAISESNTQHQVRQQKTGYAYQA